MEIRKAFNADASVISEIAMATWPSTYGEILSSDQLEYMLEQFCSTDAVLGNMKAGQQFLLASLNNKPLGFAGFTINEDKSAHLNKLYVLPENQRLHVGRNLLSEVILKCKALGCKYLTLNVNRFNKARNFYEKQGFSVISEIDIPIGHDWLMEDFVMQRKL